MAEAVQSERRGICFFLYDRSKVQEEGDLTRDGICYFYPEDTPMDHQELLCGQLAGVSRCVSELSSSPVHLLRLRRNKYAVRMREHFLWALSSAADVPDVSLCEFLDHLIELFCFCNGAVRQSYQLHSQGDLALRWARYLSHLQGGCTELHSIFSCLRTIDATHIDPLLLLKAALILQACQRCPLVLAGCILYRGRVVSTQMPPKLTMKVMVHETETYTQDHKVCSNGANPSGVAHHPNTGTTAVFLTPAELHALRCPPVDNSCRSPCSPQPAAVHLRKTRLLSRTLSDTDEPDLVELDSGHYPPPSYHALHSSPHSSLSDEPFFSPSPSLVSTPLRSSLRSQSERDTPESHDHRVANGTLQYDVGKGGESGHDSPVQQQEVSGQGEGEGLSLGDDQSENLETGENHDTDTGQNRVGALTNGYSSEPGSLSPHAHREDDLDETEEKPEAPEVSGGQEEREGEELRRSVRRECVKVGLGCESPTQPPLEPMLLYQHRVRGLVLTLLVEQSFNTDTNAKEEVYHSSLSSLNGLEAHLRTSSLGMPGSQGQYTFAHYDCVQNTLTTSVCSHSAQDRPFVKAAALMHSHFSNTNTLQEAIIRNAGCAVYGTRTAVQETYFLQQGASARNSGIPNAQDSAFTLPSKARHRLLKHGVNLL